MHPSAASEGTAPSGATIVEYVIDHYDRLVGVGGDWARFAQENGAPGLAEPPLGRPLWSFVGGTELTNLWRLLLRRVRSGPVLAQVPLRCDGPQAWRRYELTLVADRDGSVTFR